MTAKTSSEEIPDLEEKVRPLPLVRAIPRAKWDHQTSWTDHLTSDSYSPAVCAARDALQCFAYFLDTDTGPGATAQDFFKEMGTFDLVALLEAFVTLYRSDDGRTPSAGASLLVCRRAIVHHALAEHTATEQFLAITDVVQRYQHHAAHFSNDLSPSTWPLAFMTSPVPGSVSRSVYERIFRKQLRAGCLSRNHRTEYLLTQVSQTTLDYATKDLARLLAPAWEGTLPSLIETVSELTTSNCPLVSAGTG
jgi:hypothetical protein